MLARTKGGKESAKLVMPEALDYRLQSKQGEKQVKKFVLLHCGFELRALLLASVSLVVAPPLNAQIRPVIYGRVEDAASRDPVEGARIFAVDSSSVALTDSLGAFALPMRDEGPFVIQAEALGYVPDRFELERDATSRITVLLLEPSEIELAGIAEIDEDALTTLVRNLEERRLFTRSPVTVFDRTTLDGFPGGSVLDFVREQSPRLKPCDDNPLRLCVAGRWLSFWNFGPEGPVVVCVDGVRSFSPSTELGFLQIESVALIELWGGLSSGQVRVYTPQWMLSRARAGITEVTPLVVGC